MSTNTITSVSGLWKPTEYRNIEAGKVSIDPIQAGWRSARWSEDELASLRNLGRSLLPVSADLSNKYADDRRAAAFGQKPFFNARSGANEEVAYATCHLSDYYVCPAETQKALVDGLYHLDPYSGGGSGSIHAGQVATWTEVLNHYNTAPKVPMASLEQERQQTMQVSVTHVRQKKGDNHVEN